MNYFNKYIFITVLLAIGFISCEDETELDDFSNGEADFSNYVAIGNSLTAGYSNAELYRSSQINSYPALLAEQFQVVGGGSFSQPLFTTEAGFGSRLVLGTTEDCNGETSLGPVPFGGTVNPAVEGNGPFNNMGVPGIRSIELGVPGYGTLNPYFGRFQSSQSASVLGDILAQQPTFFTMWIGNNDILGYATSGGNASSEPCVPSGSEFCQNRITAPAVFQQVMDEYLQQITANDAEGVIANIPNITDIPYFNTIPQMLVQNLSAEDAASLTGAFQAVSGIVAQQLMGEGIPTEQAQAISSQYAIEWEAGNNYPVIQVEATQNNPLGWRQLTESELLVLTVNTNRVKCEGYGTIQLSPQVLQALGTIQQGGNVTPQQAEMVVNAVTPLEDGDVLSTNEINAIQQATSEYNSIIADLAGSYSLGLADMNSFFSDVAEEGISWNGADYSVEFATGGLFSLDGIHPTQKGYAVVANQFIQVINDTYNAQIPVVDVNNYPGIPLP